MRVLVACEFSAVVRDSFRARGHDAWSCDFLDSEGDNEYHIKGDARGVVGAGWDLLIAHPPCTYLASSGVSWLQRTPGRWELMLEAVDFFNTLLNAPIHRIAVENPRMHGYAQLRLGQPSQTIHPWQYGHGESKTTCLWLKHLPLLKPTDIVQIQKYAVHNMPQRRSRRQDRSRTYKGIAEAMASQWGRLNSKGERA